MKFGVLGPLTVRTSDGVPVPIRGKRLRTLLSVLLVHAGRPVAAHQLVDALWEGEPPKSYLSNLHTYVSRLRDRLPDLRIDHTDGLYTARVHPDDLDLLVFRGRVDAARLAVRRGEHAMAADLYRSALALFRDRPLLDLDAPALEPEISHLESTRLLLVEDRFEAELAAGRHVEVVAELEALVAEQPTRERLCRQLMLALCAAGRQADALAAYRTTRDRLVEAVGVEPGPALRRLHREILRGDVPEPPPVGGEASVFPICQLPPDTADFRGRHAEQRRLVAELSAAGPVPVVVLTGQAGVGKTALAVRVAHRLRARFPDGQLFLDLGGSGATPRAPGDLVAGLLRALQADVPDDVAERVAALRAVLADRRVLVVLDDAGHADQVRALLPGTTGSAVLVTALRRMDDLAGSTPVPVGPLAPEDARELLAAVAGTERVAAEVVAADEVARWCGHLPAAVRIAGTRLAQRPHLGLRAFAERLADERGRLDELCVGGVGVRSGLERVHGRLCPRARWAAGRIADLGPREVTEREVTGLFGDVVVEELMAFGLLEPRGVDRAGEPRYRLPELFRVFVLEQREG
ncbi:AfsR/SARP family transcriptional regulator [Saccharothrix variisporea]|uniref:DNA-binding SARP family transcriptional activator n=1 Tax=Saccharothrix variisporea TaxID=543527 RepID=A0A495XP30_9PSEU|nr:AfsR/SARP family transcriptional regulator [Saccharothrix variisporea]RKT73428.1 DNA-binding SARP family transcriptional activator [Saccharothrix variisporea]